MSVTVTPEQAKRLRKAFHARLLSLSYRAYSECMSRLLLRMGYEGVQLSDRIVWRRTRSQLGGQDLLARSHVGLTKFVLVAQIKQYQAKVDRRFVDELRGVMQRVGATQGLLVTTSEFTQAAKRASGNDVHLPIRLMEGGQLMDLCLRYRVGIRKRGTDRLRVDPEFFIRLERRFPLEKKQPTNNRKNISVSASPSTSDTSASVPVYDLLSLSNPHFLFY